MRHLARSIDLLQHAAIAALLATLFTLGAACATTGTVKPPPPIVITGQTLDWAGATFEVVDAGMHAANKAHALTDAQVASYEEFVSRWSAGYRQAAADWKEARKNLDQPAEQQAAGIITRLLTELATWQFVMMGATSPRAYEIPREEDQRYAFREGIRGYLVGGAP